ncbi:MAG: hypothetical protein K9J21_07320 [Bacteroidales bacterium]|nr:hypothetical protein [Bacteroidales bacterium]
MKKVKVERKSDKKIIEVYDYEVETTLKGLVQKPSQKKSASQGQQSGQNKTQKNNG